MLLKITCLGAGSLYFTRAIPDLLLNQNFKGSEILLYDINEEKAERMVVLGRRLAAAAGTGFKVKSAKGLSEAVDGADFAVSSIGGSGAEISPTVYGSYYHNADMRIPAKFGIHQVIGDTCGPAGMMMAFRSIPAYLEICREMEKRCPKVILLNHSNPMAVLCRAMQKHTDLNVIGICHGVQAGIAYAAEILEVPVGQLKCRWVGTNHYYWFTGITYQGEDLYPKLMRRIAKRKPREGRRLSAELSQIYGHLIVYPEDDHIVEFYPFLTQVPGGQKTLPYGLAKKAREHGFDERKPALKPDSDSPETRQRFFRNYQAILDRVKLPAKPDNSITGEGLGSMIDAIAHNRKEPCIVNIANNGTVPNLPATAVVEVAAVTGARGVHPLPGGEAPLVLKGILEKRFVWQELVADAAVQGDRGLALQALLMDEMTIWPGKAKEMLDQLLTHSRELLPQFFKHG